MPIVLESSEVKITEQVNLLKIVSSRITLEGATVSPNCKNNIFLAPNTLLNEQVKARGWVNVKIGNFKYIEV